MDAGDARARVAPWRQPRVATARGTQGGRFRSPVPGGRDAVTAPIRACPVRPPARVGEPHAGVVTDVDLAPAPAFTIPSDARLSEAASPLGNLGTHHLVVVDPGTGGPVGVLSTLVLMRALARGRPPAPPA